MNFWGGFFQDFFRIFAKIFVEFFVEFCRGVLFFWEKFGGDERKNAEKMDEKTIEKQGIKNLKKCESKK